MSDINKVLGSIELPDELKASIQEAWDSEVQKNREEIKEEFSTQLTEGVSTEIGSLVEAADALITSTLNSEIAELREERKQIREMAEQERVKAVKQRVLEARETKRQAQILDNIISEALKTEIKEFHEDRKQFDKQQGKMLESIASMVDEVVLKEMDEFKSDKKELRESMTKLEDLTVNQLTRELSEFQQDRVALKEKSKRLDKEYARKLEESKQAFMSRAEKSISETVDKTLFNEIHTLKEDIKVAKDNTFGRKIFEAFAGEYLTSHLSEGTEINKLRTQLEESTKNTQKMQQILKENEHKINKSKMELREARQAGKRENKLSTLMRPLNNVQRETMLELLSGVETSKLEESFKRYIPAILENSDRKTSKRRMISENKKSVKDTMTESTGERSTRNYIPQQENDVDSSDDYKDIIRLAGIKNLNK